MRRRHGRSAGALLRLFKFFGDFKGTTGKGPDVLDLPVKGFASDFDPNGEETVFFLALHKDLNCRPGTFGSDVRKEEPILVVFHPDPFVTGSGNG